MSRGQKKKIRKNKGFHGSGCLFRGVLADVQEQTDGVGKFRERLRERKTVVFDDVSDSGLNKRGQLRETEFVFRRHRVHFGEKQTVARVGKVDGFLCGGLADRDSVFLFRDIVLHFFGEHEAQEFEDEVAVDALFSHAEQVGRLCGRGRTCQFRFPLCLS